MFQNRISDWGNYNKHLGFFDGNKKERVQFLTSNFNEEKTWKQKLFAWKLFIQNVIWNVNWEDIQIVSNYVHN